MYGCLVNNNVQMLIWFFFYMKTPKREKKIPWPFFLKFISMVCFRVLMRMNSGSRRKLKFINGNSFSTFIHLELNYSNLLYVQKSIYICHDTSKINNHKKA